MSTPTRDSTEQQQKQERFMALLRPVSIPLSNYIRAMAGYSDEAKDIMSESILHAYEQFETLRDDSAFRPYLYTIARRVFMHGLHRGKRFVPLTETHRDSLPSQQPGPELAAEVRELYDAMSQLPDTQREAVALFELSGMSLKDVARLQECSLAAVKVRVMRGRNKLAALLRVDEDTHGQDTASDTGDSHE